jgi:hypothetical protein
MKNAHFLFAKKKMKPPPTAAGDLMKNSGRGACVLDFSKNPRDEYQAPMVVS